MSEMLENQVSFWTATLRNEHRLKAGVDYAIVRKYHEIRVVCDEVKL